MAEIAGGILYALKNVAETAVLVGKGIYDPTLPLKAKLTAITGVDVPRAHHTLSVVKGRGYVFGGKQPIEGGGTELADSDMHIVILATSDVESTDYRKITATGEAPPKRYQHSAAVIDSQIYVFGGCGEDGELLEENGRVWVFDTYSNKWSHLDSPNAETHPEPRIGHASVASVHPQPPAKQQDPNILPQDPPDPEQTLPDILDRNSYGTLIIQGGQGKSSTHINDLWTFDISSRSWKELPEPPPPSSTSPSLAVVGHRLYTFSAGQTSFLDFDDSAFNDIHGKGELGLAPLRPWQSFPPSSSAPEKSYPGERTGAALVYVTTGSGRDYLLLAGGNSHSGEPLEDVWILQLKPEGMTAASFKDAARLALKKDTNEREWDEVKYHNADGVMIQEGQPGRGIGPREGFAAAKANEIDEASMLLWGGIGADGQPRGDGLLITVE